MNAEMMNPLMGIGSSLPLAAQGAGAISLFQHFVVQGGWITWFR